MHSRVSRALSGSFSEQASEGAARLDWEADLEACGKEGGAGRREELRKIFDETDADGNGLLDRGEMAELAERMDQPLSAAELDAALAELDPGRSGHVTFEAFSMWYTVKHDKNKMTYGVFFDSMHELAELWCERAAGGAVVLF